MTDPIIALLEQERDYWQEAHRRRCRELLQARRQLADSPRNDHKEVIETTGWSVD